MRAAPLLILSLLGLAGPAAAQFRQDELEPRQDRYSDDRFVSQLSYRPRLSHRWAWGQANDPLRRWWWNSETALGYAITAGSVSNDELYLDQGAIVRLPMTDFLGAEYRFVETEDYDARYLRNEVELLFRFLRPGPSLNSTLGYTPPEDGLFLGAMGLLDAEKEFADVGLVGGWRGEYAGLRLDLIAPDYFFNGKAELGAEYATEPLTVRARVGTQLLDGAVELYAFWDQDLPLTLDQPIPDDLRFRFRQITAGLGARWNVREGVRCDLEATLERTRKRRRSSVDPVQNDDLDREALLVLGAMELDRPPLLGNLASRAADVVLLGFMGHYLEEETDALQVPDDQTLRRGEGYGELGYVLALPSFHEQVSFGLRLSTQQGAVSLREVREGARHTVSVRWMARIGLALEAGFRDDRVVGVFQLTYRADDQTFGGANGQVVLRF